MVYTGKDVVEHSSVFRRNRVGLVTTVPDVVVTDLSITSSERTGDQLLLLGPIRFLNSDCKPNCEYDFASESSIVQIRVR